MTVFTPPCGRLTLTPGVACPASDVASATAIHYVSVGGNGVPVYDGSSIVMQELGAPLALNLDDDPTHAGYHQSGNIYDVFAFIHGGSLKLGTAMAWANSNAGACFRGSGVGTTEIDDVVGVFANKHPVTLRIGRGLSDTVAVAAHCATYVGSFKATLDGVTADTVLRRLLFNAYNQVIRGFRARGPELNYVYCTAAYRVQGGDANTRADILLGLSGIWVSAVTSAYVSADVQSGIFVAIGLNSLATPSLDSVPALRIGSLPELVWTKFGGYLPIGYNFLASLEKGSGAGTQTWLGTLDGHGLVGSYLG